MDIILFLAVVYLFTFFVGILLEKIRIPWIFASLIFGLLLAAYNPFPIVTNSETFKFLANLGMLFLLLMIGLEIDLKEMISKSKFFMKATTFIILFETLFFWVFLVYFCSCCYVLCYGWRSCAYTNLR